MKILLYFIIAINLINTSIYGQSQKTEVLILGTFHFDFPNLDIQKTSKIDQIDVLDPKYQLEIEEIANKISKFKPTIIAIERDPGEQKEYDSLYLDYLQNKYILKRNEAEQFAFRIAKKLSIKKIYCINAWGQDYESLNHVLQGTDSNAYKQFINYFYSNPDTLLLFAPKPVFKTEGILAELKRLNSENNINQDMGNYLIGIFKYETSSNEYFGPDFVTGWWFNRNLRIFRNIQKIQAKPTDRILIIYGAGHLNILNILFNASPEYKLIKTNDFLK